MPKFARRLTILVLLALCWRLCAADPTQAADLEQRCYRQQIADRTLYFSWSLDHDPPLRLQTSEPGERFSLQADSDFGTRSWQLDRPAEKTRLRVERQGDTLVWSGTLKGRPLERRAAIDAAPWFQGLSLSLRSLLAPGRQRLEFWMIRPDTLELHKLRAERYRTAPLRLAGAVYDSVQIRVTVPGIPAFLWHGDYWFDPRDGRFLRFAGRAGLPGSPDIRVELLGGPAAGACGEDATLPTARLESPP